MHRQLILEGSDGAGKTTFARKLESEGWRVRHVGPPSTNNFGQEVLELLTTVNGPTVWDRLYLGELVYGTMLRGDNGIQLGDFNLIEAWLTSSGAQHLWFNTDPEVCHQRVGNAGPDGNLSQVEAFSRYLSAFNRSCVTWQATSQADEQFWLGYAARFLSNPPPFHYDFEGLGSANPTFWVLGEQFNPNAKIQQPFATPAGRALIWPAIDVNQHRVSNALQANSKSSISRARQHDIAEADIINLYERWMCLGEPQAIALGDVAKTMCSRAGIPSSNLVHPQFAFRFDSKNRSAYLTKMREALA